MASVEIKPELARRGLFTETYLVGPYTVLTLELGESYEQLKQRAIRLGFTTENRVGTHDLRRSEPEEVEAIITEAADRGYDLTPGRMHFVYRQTKIRLRLPRIGKGG